MNLVSCHLFFTCAFGSEEALKKEIKKDFPFLKLGYSKKGILTFSSEKKIPLTFNFDSIFCLSYGISRGLYKTINFDLNNTKDGIVHVYCRETHKRNDDIENPLNLKVKEFVETHKLPQKENVKNGELIHDLILVDDEHLIWGSHYHHAGHLVGIGGIPKIELPQDVPSKAYLKISEALAKNKLPIKKEHLILDVGCAPGGYSYYWLKQGHLVFGVDAGNVGSIVLNNSKFKWINKSIGNVTLLELPKNIDWISIDMNVKPIIMYKELKKLVEIYPKLKGAVVTLKMPTIDHYKEVLTDLNKIKKLGFKSVSALQLFYNKQEITAILEK